MRSFILLSVASHCPLAENPASGLLSRLDFNLATFTLLSATFIFARRSTRPWFTGVKSRRQKFSLLLLTPKITTSALPSVRLIWKLS